MKKLQVLASALGLLIGLSGCPNIFDPVDSPHGDAQILSAARAAFDKGDIAGARELYGKISTNQSAISDLVFVDLDGCGATIGAFASALVHGIDSTGLMLTIMAEHMASLHGTTCLATLLQAYKNSLTITDPDLLGFTSLMASIAIAGEVVAHNTGVQDGTLSIADFVVSSQCTGGTTCSGGGACIVADGISAAAVTTLSSAGSITPTWGVVQGAFNAANTALGQMGVTTGPAYQLINAAGLAGMSNNNDNYRCALRAIGVGR